MILSIYIGADGAIALLSPEDDGPKTAVPSTGHYWRVSSLTAIEGVLAAAGIPVTFVTPASWKRAAGLAPGWDKDAARAEAIRRWPGQAELFARKKDDGLAEAALIGFAGLLASPQDKWAKIDSQRVTELTKAEP